MITESLLKISTKINSIKVNHPYYQQQIHALSCDKTKTCQFIQQEANSSPFQTQKTFEMAHNHKHLPDRINPNRKWLMGKQMDSRFRHIFVVVVVVIFEVVWSAHHHCHRWWTKLCDSEMHYTMSVSEKPTIFSLLWYIILSGLWKDLEQKGNPTRIS